MYRWYLLLNCPVSFGSTAPVLLLVFMSKGLPESRKERTVTKPV